MLWLFNYSCLLQRYGIFLIAPTFRSLLFVFMLTYVKNWMVFKDLRMAFFGQKSESSYLCNVFFIVLDLRLTRNGLSGVLFFCLFSHNLYKVQPSFRHHNSNLDASRHSLLRCQGGGSYVAHKQAKQTGLYNIDERLKRGTWLLPKNDLSSERVD